jgi:transposase-like protein
MLWFQRERTPFQAVLYGLYLYALGLSFRRVSDALEPFVQRSYVAVWDWVQRYGKHVIYSDGGVWFPEACASLGLEHRVHSSYEKSVMERVMEYLKDRVEGFDDYYPCTRDECSLKHVRNWLNLFVYIHNARRYHIRFSGLVSLIGGELTQQRPSLQRRNNIARLSTIPQMRGVLRRASLTDFVRMKITLPRIDNLPQL